MQRRTGQTSQNQESYYLNRRIQNLEENLDKFSQDVNTNLSTFFENVNNNIELNVDMLIKYIQILHKGLHDLATVLTASETHNRAATVMNDMNEKIQKLNS